MTQWLVDTLVWTGLLIALVLLLRRPVGRYFGAKAAYALWALPLLRLGVPPLVLPAWLAFGASVPEQRAVQVTEYAADLATIPAVQAASAGADPAGFSLPLGAILLTAWLAGAAIFLAVRFSNYFRMRKCLLADARPVGEAGAVRLVETPQATAPLAFGVFDKVVALPPGFMALHDREQRDFALAHELAHHAGRDLLANMAAQPLFALHWFNPLAWLGWRALRRDQEAACDARVIARRSARDRAVYAQTIAGFAAGPHLTLAAPMACPILGEKSIIHRLRSISMSDISPRRRIAGRALIGASLLALPLTASISYAETRTRDDAWPEQPPVPPAPPAPPEAAVPLAPPAPPAMPEAPEIPEAPEAPETLSMWEAPLPPTPPAPPAPPRVAVRGDGDRQVVTMHRDSRGLSSEERAEIRRELKAAMAEVDAAMAEAARDRSAAMIEMRKARRQIARLKADCKEDTSGQVCDPDSLAHALADLEEARRAFASNPALGEEIRAQVLAQLDVQIAQFKP